MLSCLVYIYICLCMLYFLYLCLWYRNYNGLQDYVEYGEISYASETDG